MRGNTQYNGFENSHWKQCISACSFNFRMQIHSLWGYADAHKVTTNRTSQVHFMISFDRDLQFIDRHDIIRDIDQRLKTKRRIALAGIGGVG